VSAGCSQKAGLDSLPRTSSRFEFGKLRTNTFKQAAEREAKVTSMAEVRIWASAPHALGSDQIVRCTY